MVAPSHWAASQRFPNAKKETVVKPAIDLKIDGPASKFQEWVYTLQMLLLFLAIRLNKEYS